MITKVQQVALAIARRNRKERLASSISSPPAFTPASLFTSSNKGGWWDFHDLSNMFQNSGGTGAVVNGDPVGQVKNKATALTSPANFIQSVSGNRPTKSATWGVEFNHVSNQLMWCDLPAAIDGDTLHCVMTFRIISYSAAFMRILSFGTNGIADFNNVPSCAPILREGSSDTVGGYRANVMRSKLATVLTGVNMRVESLFDGTNHRFRIGSTDGTPVASTLAFSIVRLGLAYELTAVTSFANIRVGDLIVRDTPITGTDLTDLRTFLDARLT